MFVVLLFLVWPLFVFGGDRGLCFSRAGYLYCPRGTFQKIVGLDEKTDEPLFKYSVPADLLHEYPEYFQVFEVHKDTQKVGISYAYYKNNKLSGRYVFLIDGQTGRYRRAKATWYNYKGLPDQENVYYVSGNLEQGYSHQFTYYNVFGKPVRRTLQFFKDEEFLYQDSYAE